MAVAAWREWARLLPRPGRSCTVGAPADPADAAVRAATSGGDCDGEYVVYERAGTWYVALAPAASLTVGATRVVARAAGRSWQVPLAGCPLAVVADALAALPHGEWRAYGWAGFGLGHVLHGDPRDAGTAPLLHLLLPATEVELTPGRALVRTAGDPRAADRIAAALRQPAPAAVPLLTDPEALMRRSPEAYRRAVARTVRDIRAGRLRKAVISRTVLLPSGTRPDLAAGYLAGRRANTPARSYLLRAGGWRAAGFSPETVLEVMPDGRVCTQPLAGTRALGADPGRNRLLREELLADAKEVHEHALSVQLAVHELAGVCRPGSVRVEEFLTVRERGSVQHLASRVAGRLRDELGAWSAFAALFPAVTVSGVPKSAALRAIGRHESEPRGLYGGAVFTADADGSLDAALVLRTVFQHGGRTWLRAGAGVVDRSTPEREWEETCEKLRSVAPHLRRRRVLAAP
ncbi:salicylate synthase [Streptomyces sp. NPDC001262]|uniref:salicylate synthase n=1 Tax=Streptomyces sp. NPDC001262 TaxID=3364552 RepID=UPI0036B82B15